MLIKVNYGPFCYYLNYLRVTRLKKAIHTFHLAARAWGEISMTALFGRNRFPATPLSGSLDDFKSTRGKGLLISSGLRGNIPFVAPSQNPG